MSTSARTRARVWRQAALLGVCAAVVAACGGAQHPTGVVTIAFEPAIVSVDPTGEAPSDGTFADTTDLFFEANDYLDAGDYSDALRLYALVVEHATDPEFLRAARYNSALAMEGLGRWREAGTLYRGLIIDEPATVDAKDAHFRLAECFAQVGQHDAVAPLMTNVLTRTDLAVFEEVEAHLRWGLAAYEEGAFADAAVQLTEALATNRRAEVVYDPESSDARDVPLEASDPLIAHTLYALGRVYHTLFADIRLVLPEQRLAGDLVDKTQLFERSQDAYLEAVRTGNPHWAVAAGYQVGQLFEDYYFDVLATEVPADFGALELEIYFEELRAFIAPAMERAQSIYEHNLGMAFRLGAEGEWVEATRERLHAVNEYVRTQATWDEEHRLVVERRHPHSAPDAEHGQTRAPAPRTP